MAAMVVKKSLKKKRKSIPKELIYEMVKRRPIYYKDYDQVLSGDKTLEEVMGSSGIQSWLIANLVAFLINVLKDKYAIVTNETGLKLAPGSWRNADIAIFEKEKVKDYLLQNEYIPIPPKVVLEIDTKADLRKFNTTMDYFYEKTDDLLAWGVEKVLWIFTKSQKIMIAEKDKHWITINWDEDVNVIDDLSFNINDLIKL